MYRTVIADDDFLVRSYLKQLGAWKKAGYEIVADLRDGEEALSVILKKRPDVIVIDISMPLMDGIELIRHVREEDEKIYIIVLSCHDEFEYVKEAMKLGANEYVLKNSLDEESLYELLKNAESQIKKNRTKNSKIDENKKLIEAGRQSLKYQFFNGLLANAFTSEERNQKRKEAGVKGKYHNSAVVTMFEPRWSELKLQLSVPKLEQYSQRFLRKLYDALFNILNDEVQKTEVIYLGEGVYCCFLDLSEMRRSSLMKDRVTSVANSCLRCCQTENIEFVVGVSSICYGKEGLREAYRQAREMLKLSFYLENDILFYEGKSFISQTLPSSADRLLENIKTYLAGHQWEKMEKEFMQVIEDFRNAYVDSRLVQRWLRELDYKAECSGNMEDRWITKVDQLMDVYEQYRQKIFIIKKKELPPGISPAIRKMVDFLHEHYMEQISLTEAAQVVNMNPAYVSYLFKQDMGVGFSNYLLELRLECVKSMLIKTNEKIKDVAFKSGFHDYRYFSKAFKKQNGISAADYRKQHQ